jgi:hypothetical protein
MGHISCDKGVWVMTIIIDNPPDGLPRETNLKIDEATSILWKVKPKKRGEEIDNICSFARCKKEILKEDDGILLEDMQTDLIAYFHIDCFRSLLQKESLNTDKKITDIDVREEERKRKGRFGKGPSLL